MICRQEQKEREEEFPELLLSSLDQLCMGKQQQLFLVSNNYKDKRQKTKDQLCSEHPSVHGQSIAVFLREQNWVFG